jgi:tRNA 2-selenouridine synthase
MEDFIREVLVYYDKTYRTGLKGRDDRRIVEVPVKDGNAVENAGLVLAAAGKVLAAVGGI